MTNASDPADRPAASDPADRVEHDAYEHDDLAAAAPDVDEEAHRGDDVGDQFAIGLASASTGGAAVPTESASDDPLPGESD